MNPALYEGCVERDAERFRMALWIVHDLDEAACLAALGLSATIVASEAEVLAGARSAAEHGHPIVLVQQTEGALRRFLHDHVPTADLHDFALPRGANSISGMLGFSRGEPWDDATIEVRRYLLLSEAAERARLSVRGEVVDADGLPIGPVVEIVRPVAASTAPWPRPMSNAVRIGVLGELLELVEAQTEADPAAIAVDFLVRVGNAVGRSPYFEVSGDRHGTNLFACIVGGTSVGRKGSSAAFPKRVVELAAPEWAASCVKTGLSSGEGLVYALRDPCETGKVDRDGDPIVDPGAADKRLFVAEPELARTMRAAGRQGSILSAVLRMAWEGSRLASLTKASYSATDAHVSLVAHVSPEEFRGLLRDDDISGGTVNRLLFVCSRRQRQLPFGGAVDEIELARLAVRVRDVIEFGSALGRVDFTDAARVAWPDLYARLQLDEQAPGVRSKLLGRATAQVRRLAMLFAIIDKCGAVDVRHLNAAAEVWRYSRETIAYVFGTSTGNRVADRILGELRGTPAGIARTAMHALFDRNVSAADIDAALVVLHEARLAHGKKVAGARGRPAEVWHATNGEHA